MKIVAGNVDEYYASVPADKKQAIDKLRNIFKKNLPKGFEEQLYYGMPGFVVPLKTYPKGYHVAPGTPLGFVSIAAQKNFIALYHMGLYGDKNLLKWFTEQYAKQSKFKLDMGKSCVRFKNPDAIPFDLIAELATKISPAEFVANYEKNLGLK